jgi:hypothetical protein
MIMEAVSAEFHVYNCVVAHTFAASQYRISILSNNVLAANRKCRTGTNQTLLVSEDV